MQTRKPVPKMLQFLRDNQPRNAPIKVQETNSEAADVYLYDAIDPYWGISAQTFAETLAAITAPVLNLHINSPGGDVFEARAMVAAIRNYPGKVVAHIDGLAASAATYVALAASEVRMNAGAFLMIHNAWTIAFGNASDLLAMAALLEKIDGTIIADYTRKTGKDEATLRAWMAAETWFTADEAKAEGFIDAIDNAADPQPTDRWNMAAFDKAPKALIKPTPKNMAPLSAPAAEYVAAELIECTASLARAKSFIIANPDDPLREFAEEDMEEEAGCIELLKLYQQAGTESSAPANQQPEEDALRASAARRFRLLETGPA